MQAGSSHAKAWTLRTWGVTWRGRQKEVGGVLGEAGTPEVTTLKC